MEAIDEGGSSTWHFTGVLSSTSNLNKEGVRFLIISLSDLEFIPSTYLNPLW